MQATRRPPPGRRTSGACEKGRRGRFHGGEGMAIDDPVFCPDEPDQPGGETLVLLDPPFAVVSCAS